jgi:23S rRNA pseudouridine2605 synthase
MGQEQRLQKIIAAAGVSSRRKAELLIRQGRVTVNGQTVTELGAKADPERDRIKVDGRTVRESGRKVYVLLNKPRGVISSVSDPQGREKVIDLVDIKQKIYPAGRLDYNTEGLILLTNDGEFSRIVSRAGTQMPKVYQVKVKSIPANSSLEQLRKGIRLKSGVRLAPCRIVPIKEGTNSWYEVALTQGKNRQIKEMFDSIGHAVLKLRRIRIGFLSNHGLAVGQYRFLSSGEVERILRLSGKQ